LGAGLYSPREFAEFSSLLEHQPTLPSPQDKFGRSGKTSIDGIYGMRILNMRSSPFQLGNKFELKPKGGPKVKIELVEVDLTHSNG
jgi:hypothetical protein